MSREIWRLLEKNEKKQIGDEFIDLTVNGSSWTRLDSYGFNERQSSGCIYRRRETIEDEPKWVSVKERKPTIDDACGDAVAVIWEYDGSLSIAHWRSVEPNLYSYWLKVPKSPKPDSFETFWQTNKEKLIDVSKEAAKLIYEKARV